MLVLFVGKYLKVWNCWQCTGEPVIELFRRHAGRTVPVPYSAGRPDGVPTANYSKALSSIIYFDTGLLNVGRKVRWTVFHCLLEG